MTTLDALDTLYAELQKLDRTDPVRSAIYREEAQDILASPKIALQTRKEIADLLHQANQRLTLHTATNDDSY